MDLTTYAIPAFVLLLAVEILAYRFTPDDDDRRGYAPKDTATSLSMGLGSIAANLGWGLLAILVWSAAFEATPLDVPGTWWGWALAVLAVDFFYYWEHRAMHEVRLLWASHVVHHSSRHYNLSTALRQSWTGAHHLVFMAPVALLGFEPAMVFAAYSVNLIYQFWIHTERIGRLWRPVEYVINTPSHHRVHHGSNRQYLDRNYGGILIVWDRLFGSFEPEGEKVDYGLTKNIATYNPLRVAFHEYWAIGHDVRHAASWRERFGRVLRGPGWSPARSGGGGVSTASDGGAVSTASDGGGVSVAAGPVPSGAGAAAGAAPVPFGAGASAAAAPASVGAGASATPTAATAAVTATATTAAALPTTTTVTTPVPATAAAALPTTAPAAATAPTAATTATPVPARTAATAAAASATPAVAQTVQPAQASAEATA